MDILYDLNFFNTCYECHLEFVQLVSKNPSYYFYLIVNLLYYIITNQKSISPILNDYLIVQIIDSLYINFFYG